MLQAWFVVLIVIVAAVIIVAVWLTLVAHRRQASTGREELIDKKAVVKDALSPEGSVFLEGERWNAVSESGEIQPGEEVVITRVDGLKLFVRKENAQLEKGGNE